MAKRFHILIIGSGNSLRRDDGAGGVLALRLTDYWRRQGRYVRCLIVQQLTPDLAFDISADDVQAVVFVDAVLPAAETQGDSPQLVFAEIQESGYSSGVGHHLDAGELMVYAQLLYRRRPPAWMVLIPGVDFSHGEGLSKPVLDLIDDVPAIADELEKLLAPCLSFS